MPLALVLHEPVGAQLAVKTLAGHPQLARRLALVAAGQLQRFQNGGLLDLIEAGTPPRYGLGHWFKNLSLPDWMDFMD